MRDMKKINQRIARVKHQSGNTHGVNLKALNSEITDLGIEKNMAVKEGKERDCHKILEDACDEAAHTIHHSARGRCFIGGGEIPQWRWDLAFSNP